MNWLDIFQYCIAGLILIRIGEWLGARRERDKIMQSKKPMNYSYNCSRCDLLIETNDAPTMQRLIDRHETSHIQEELGK